MKKYQSRKKIIEIFVICCVTLVLVWGILFFHENWIYDYTFDSKKLTDISDFEFNIDSISYRKNSLVTTKDYIEIGGWLMKPGESIDSVNLKIILKDTASDKAYILPTTMVERIDVTNAFADDYFQYNYTQSGFKVKIPQSNEIDTDERDYEVMALYTLNGTEYLLSFNTTVKTWENQFHQPISEDYFSKDTTEGYQYGIESIGLGKNKYFKISGWIIKEGVSSENAVVKVVIKNKNTDEYFSLPTEVIERTDITETIDDGINYDLSGFYVNIEQDEVINVSKYDYEIFISYEEDGINYLIPMNTTIKEWGGTGNEN